jgi:hypothetical protein
MGFWENLRGMFVENTRDLLISMPIMEFMILWLFEAQSLDLFEVFDFGSTCVCATGSEVSVKSCCVSFY